MLTLKLLAVSDAEGNDLLLHPFERGYTVVPHTDVLLHRVIFLVRDIHRAVGVIGKAFADPLRVPAICLNVLSGC